MKISFDTANDSVEQVLEVIKAVYGVEVTLGGAPEAVSPQQFASAAVESDSVQEQGSVSEPEATAPAERLVVVVPEQAAEAKASAKRARSRSAVKPAKADGAETRETAKTAPTKKTAAKKAPAKKSAAKAAPKTASAPRPRTATAATAVTEAPGRGRSSRATATTKSEKAQKKGVKPEAKLVRAWAREQGLENVPGRGMLPARIYEQYSAAHA